MYYGNIKNFDIANGEGVRVSLFVSGCTNHCKNCFQPETWDFFYGKPFTVAEEQRIFDYLSPHYINGLSILGGEPMEPDNQKALYPFLQRVRESYPNKTIWIYSGFTFEQLTKEGEYSHTEITSKLLGLCDVLVDGRFEEALKNLCLAFRGSSNQRIIDLNESLKMGRTILLEKHFSE